MRQPSRVAVGAAALIAGLALAAPLPYSGKDAAPADEEEGRMWSAGEELDGALEKSGMILPDVETTRYVQAVVDKLFPEFEGKIRIRIIKSPHLNAFALPNGSIYINHGLLARFDNEAQLASVLAHEGSHFTHRHGYRNQQTVKDISAFSTVTAMLGVPLLLNQVLTLSSILGYSRELETEADNQGFRRLVTAGYDVREAPRVFEYLVKEIKLAEIKELYFFSSHPKLQDRIDNFKQLAAGVPPGGTSLGPEYLAHMERLRIADLEQQLSMGRYKNVVLILKDEEKLKVYPAYAPFYLGEAYRLRKQEGDDVLAEEAYRKAVRNAPDFAPSYRALGVHYLKKKAYSDAKQYFNKYLEMAPDAKDRKYVEQYLVMIGKQDGIAQREGAPR